MLQSIGEPTPPGGGLPDPWYRVTVELVTAHLGEVVIAQAPGTVWAIGGAGELALVRRSGTGLRWVNEDTAGQSWITHEGD
jgi:hypothetical protein